MQVLEIPIDLIEVGDRRRLDFGDIGAVAKSMKRLGLLAPIIVDRNGTAGHYRLIAGERRLKAARSLDWENIPAVLKENLSEEQLRDIELEENEIRKPFTEQERRRTFTSSKQLVEAVMKATEVIARSGQKPNQKGTKGGRPHKPTSPQKVAESLGTSRQSIERAEKHVSLAEKLSWLQGAQWRQADVLRFEQFLLKVPEEEQAELGNFIARIYSPTAPNPDQGLEVAEVMTIKTPEARAVIYNLSKSSDKRERDLAIARAVHRPPTPDARISILQNVLAELIKAVEPPFDKDPVAQELRVIGNQLAAIRSRLRKQYEQTKQKEEEDLQTDLRATK